MSLNNDFQVVVGGPFETGLLAKLKISRIERRMKRLVKSVLDVVFALVIWAVILAFLGWLLMQVIQYGFEFLVYLLYRYN